MHLISLVVVIRLLFFLINVGEGVLKLFFKQGDQVFKNVLVESILNDKTPSNFLWV